MKWKRIWISLWLLTLLAIFIVTLVNHSPYFLLGGSSSVAPVMEELLTEYPDNHKKGDFNYVSSASSGAPSRVSSGLFGIGWLSEQYSTNNSDLFTFQLLRDGLIIVYNLPKDKINNPTVPLDFTQDTVKDLYLNQKPWNEVFPNRITSYIPVKTFTRPNGSGTRSVFDNKVLGGVTYYQSNTVDSSSAMLSLDTGSIGYTSYADLSQSKERLVSAGTWNNVEATYETIKNGQYDLWRPFTGLINYNYQYKEEIAKLLNWIFNNSSADRILKKYGPKVSLNRPENLKLKHWLEIILKT